MTATQYKLTGEILLIIPLIILLVLGISEVSDGITSGIQHFAQLIPLTILALTSWFYPKIGGILLLASALILSITYFIAFSSFPIFQRLFYDLILFGTPIIAGVLFIKTDRKTT